MNFNIEKSIELLERTPETFAALFHNSEHHWDLVNEGKNTWNGYNIIGHLIHGEKTDWIPRAEIILGKSTNKTFKPYDRFAQENLYATQSIEELLNEFKHVRYESRSSILF